jgi:aminoglycoside phosphotransferase (APT) family kinase protein
VVTEAPVEDRLAAALEAFFRRRSAEPGSLRLVGYDRITGGYSRLMLRAWVEDAEGRRGYIVRADPPPGESIVDTNRGDEWSLLCALREAGTIPMPAALWFDPAGEELGSPAIVTELIDGPSLLRAGVGRSPSEQLALAEPMCELAARIHAFDVAALPPHLDRPGSWDDYVDAHIEEWVEGERAFPGADPFMRMLACWLRANKPPPVPLGLVHGDFQPANIVVGPDSGYRMIDWEMAHVGDPREDLGWMVLCGINQPPHLIAADPRAFYDRYAERTSLPPEAVDDAAIAWFTVLGSTRVFLRIAERLATLIRGEASSALLAYMADSVAGMHNVFMDAIERHARATGAGA